MTAQELRQIYYLNQELEMWKEELNKLIYTDSLPKAQKLTGMPHAPQGKVTDSVGDLAVEIEETINIIKGIQAKVNVQKRKIIAWIDSVDDSYMRQIIYFRNVECLKWEEVAQRMGIGSNEDAIKKQYYRYLKDHK